MHKSRWQQIGQIFMRLILKNNNGIGKKDLNSIPRYTLVYGDHNKNFIRHKIDVG